jgi:hypothetical protein
MKFILPLFYGDNETHEGRGVRQMSKRIAAITASLSMFLLEVVFIHFFVCAKQ